MLFDFTREIPAPGFKLLATTGQVYRLISASPYVRKDGEASTLLTWSSKCAQCREDITLTSGLKAKALNRRCDAHKSPGLPADTGATERQAVARKAYGERMQAYNREAKDAQSGATPLRPTKIIDTRYEASSCSLRGHAKLNSRAVIPFQFAIDPLTGARMVLCRGPFEETFEPFLDGLALTLETEIRKALF